MLLGIRQFIVEVDVCRSLSVVLMANRVVDSYVLVIIKHIVLREKPQHPVRTHSELLQKSESLLCTFSEHLMDRFVQSH